MKFPNRGVWLSVALGAVLGCTEPPAPPTPSRKLPIPGRNESPRAPAGLRRLSLVELEQESLRLTGLEKSTAGMLVDQRVDGYDNDADILQVTEARIDDLIAHAERLSKVLVAQAPACPTEKPADCAKRLIASTAERAWGRSVHADEKARLEAVYLTNVPASGHLRALELSLEAVLLSPHFLYRSELGAGESLRGRSLERWEAAAALSFFLTGERPDAELMAAAQHGSLETADGREEQARRLLHTPKGEATLRRFFRQWLALPHLDALPKDTNVFPEFDAKMRSAVAAELDAWVTREVLEENRSFAELMTDPVPPFPGLEAIYGVTLNVGAFARERRGLLSLAAVLAGHSPTEATSPTRRGLFVRTRLFCKGIAPPPPGALANPPDLRNRDTSTREKFEQHSKDSRCSGCHQLMDPAGFGLESFDAIGRFRAFDNHKRVDDSGALHGTDVDGPFRGPAALGDKVAESAQALDCFQQHLARFALGRHARYARTGAARLGIESLIIDLVRDDGFVTRDAPEVTP